MPHTPYHDANGSGSGQQAGSQINQGNYDPMVHEADRLFYIDQAMDQLRALATYYHQFEQYDMGFQPIMFSSHAFRRFYSEVMRRYRLNMVRPVIDAISERITITGFEGDDGLQSWWLNDGIRMQNRLHRQAVRAGDAFVLVWPSKTMDGELKAHRILSTEATVVYSDESERPEFGVKTWAWEVAKDRYQQRLNVYYPTHVERYVRQGTESISYTGAGSFRFFEDDDAGPVIEYDGTLKEQGEDGHLPLVHFAVQPDLTPFGTSAVEDVIPLQDALNKHAIDLLVTSESLALPLRALMGFEVTEGPDGKPSNLPDYDPRLDYFLTIPGEAAKLIQLDAGDMSQLMKAKESAVDDIAAVAGIHQSRLRSIGAIPSGEALRVVERPLVSQVRNIQSDFTAPWAQVARLLGYDGQPMWSDPIEMDVTEVWGLVQQKLDAGWPARQAYIEAGLDPEEVDRILTEGQQRNGMMRQTLDMGVML